MSQEVKTPSWMKVISGYNKPNIAHSWIQLSLNLILLATGWFLMALFFKTSYWLVLLLAIPTSGILVRIFIIFHDCLHGSFFKSKKLNAVIGHITGILTFTPYKTWGKSHIIHHRTAGNLEKRGTGDVWTVTVKEYLKMSRWEKLKYQAYRHPIIMFLLGSIISFVILNRFTNRDMDQAGRLSVYITNAGLLSYAVGMSFLIGFTPFILIQLPLIHIAGIFGIWLFYVQHQFDPSYWTHDKDWDYQRVALEGSSFYKLPPLLRWFTGNIGYHHIHHLSPLIPNYNLRRCHNENEMFRNVRPLTIRRSLKSMMFRLWDEDNKMMIRFNDLRKRSSLAVT